MPAFCLIPQYVEKFKQGLVSREIDPEKLSQLSSSERRSFLEKYVGKDNAEQTNALFESKLLLKNQQAGYINWAKKVSGITKEAKRDLISRIERMDKVLNPADEKAFLQDLASQRLGVGVSFEEAKTIGDLSTKIQDLKAKVTPEGRFPSKDDRLNYGWANVQMENYIRDLKLKSPIKKSILTAPFRLAAELPGAAKSLLASLDDSFYGRQGLKTLLDPKTSGIWFKNFSKSFYDFGRGALKGDAIEAIKSDVYSRPNAINGKYKAMGLDIGQLSEEAYPSSLPEKIPLLGRLFRGSEAAFNGGALRLRADLADKYISLAEKNGINMLDKKEAQGLGILINSLTGRGRLGLTASQSKKINIAAFSAKFLKSNFDFLTAHSFDSKVSSFAKAEARRNLRNVVGTLAVILTTAKALDPNSVEEDPRSKNFGSVKVFGNWHDLSFGSAGLVNLAMQLSPTLHNNKWGFWRKEKNGSYTDLGTKYGASTPLDVAENYFEGKLSPVAGIIRDILARKTYSGQPTTVSTEVGNMAPLPIQSYENFIKNPESSNILGSMILETFGVTGRPSIYPTDWSTKTNKEMTQFKQAVGEEKFKQANDKFNQQFNRWYTNILKSDSYKKLSDDDKQALQTKAKDSIQSKVFKEYDFKFKKAKPNKRSNLKQYLP